MKLLFKVQISPYHPTSDTNKSGLYYELYELNQVNAQFFFCVGMLIQGLFIISIVK